MHPDLKPNLLLSAYAQGVFPMADDDGEIYWFSPDPRAVIELSAFRVTRSLRKVYDRGAFELAVNRNFPEVIAACGERSEGTWISGEIVEAYCELHNLGFAHSVESYRDRRLVGGLYGVALGGAFFGESMFHRETDASKVALVHLVERMRKRGYKLLDVQFQTPHLKRFGATEIPRAEYVRRLTEALREPCTFVDPPERAK